MPDGNFAGTDRQARKKRLIVHVDMDAFFAAVEQRDDPSLRGKPVVIGADPKNGKGRGVVSTASYEAREFGIRSAMPISQAYQRCPKAIFLPPDMEKYSRASREIYDIFYEFTPEIEPVGIDEAFLDITGSHHLFGTPLKTCLMIKEKIRKKTVLTASIGLAPTKMAAKIASDLEKPDGMVEVEEEGIMEFLKPLDIRKLWGLGEKSEKVLNDAGIRTIGELAAKDPVIVESLFGKNGVHFWRLANGIDDSEVAAAGEAKSISNETTFEKDTLDRSLIESSLAALCERVSDRLREEGLKARTITLKIRLQGFATYTRAVTMEVPTNFADVIYSHIKKLYDNFDAKGRKVRLVGVKSSNFSLASSKSDLFENTKENTKKEKVYSAVDDIKRKFGDSAIFRAGSIAA